MRVVSLVVEDLHDDPARARRRSPNPTQPNPTQPRASVLIVDDDERTHETWSAFLRAAGFETATAATGQAGLDFAQQRSFDLCLIDLRLPDMSGIDVVRELKRRGVPGRAVIVTAFPALDTSFDAGVCGADGYVDGPLDGDDVVELVRNAIEGHVPVRHPRRWPSDRADLPQGLDPRVRAVMRLIVSDLARAWSVEELSAAVDMSESGLRHLFHSELGVSMTAFRAERRLQEGAWRLTTTHQAIRQIAYGLGHRSEDFRRAFRERFGMSPRAYRAKFWRGPGSFV